MLIFKTPNLEIKDSVQVKKVKSSYQKNKLTLKLKKIPLYYLTLGLRNKTNIMNLNKKNNTDFKSLPKTSKE